MTGSVWQPGQNYRQTKRYVYSAAAHKRALRVVDRLWEQMHAARVAGDDQEYGRSRTQLLEAWREVRRVARLPRRRRDA